MLAHNWVYAFKPFFQFQSMKAIIMAGGYAKRLWPLTKNFPKPLLEVGGRSIIDYALEKIENIPQVDKVYISTNRKFEGNLKDWLSKRKTSKKIEIVTEPTLSEDQKLGAIGAFRYVIDQKGIDDDLLIIAGDNIFEFDVNRLMDFFSRTNRCVLGGFDVGSLDAVKGKYGIVVLNGTKITDFLEKPENPPSSLASTGIYIFTKETLPLIDGYLKGGNKPDAPGFFISWLHKMQDVHCFVFKDKWFDIGSFEGLEEAKNYFNKKNSEVLTCD